MEYTTLSEQQRYYIRLNGPFNFTDSQKFRDILRIVDETQGAMVLDLAGVTFMDSAALGMLLLLRDKAAQRGISLTLQSPKGQVKKVFDVSRFEQLFTIVNAA